MRGIRVGITEERIAKLHEQCVLLNKYPGRIPRREVRQVAGLMTWMSGLMPPTEAVRQHGVGGPPKHEGADRATPPTQLAVEVVPSSCSAKLGPLEIRSRSGAEYFTVLAFDGSLQGGGATLQTAVRDLCTAAHQPLISY